MLISTEISSYRKLGDNKKILKLLKESGFTAYDFSMFKGGLADEILYADDYAQKAREFRAFADGLGLPCNQSHAPFPTAKKGDIEYNEAMFPIIVRAIEVSGILGVKVCVVHPCNDYTPEENLEIYRKFEPYARKAGVKIGVENMWNWTSEPIHATPAACSSPESFRKHLDLLPKDVFVACLDIGHAEMRGLKTSAAQMIETLADRLEAIHLHDNDLVHDNHAIPFTYDINYEPIIEAMKKIGYQGDITLEADCYALKAPLELLPAVAKYAASVAEYFKNKIQNK